MNVFITSGPGFSMLVLFYLFLFLFRSLIIFSFIVLLSILPNKCYLVYVFFPFCCSYEKEIFPNYAKTT